MFKGLDASCGRVTGGCHSSLGLLQFCKIKKANKQHTCPPPSQYPTCVTRTHYCFNQNGIKLNFWQVQKTWGSVKSSCSGEICTHRFIKKAKHTTSSAALLHSYVDSFLETNQLGRPGPVSIDNQMSWLGSKSLLPLLDINICCISTYLAFNFHLVRAAIKPRTHPCSKSAKLISLNLKKHKNSPQTTSPQKEQMHTKLYSITTLYAFIIQWILYK